MNKLALKMIIPYVPVINVFYTLALTYGLLESVISSMDTFLFSQFLVAIAFICDLASFQFRSRNKILVCLVISTVLVSTHYFLLSNPSAGFLMLLAAVRFAVACVSKRALWMWLFTVAALLLLWATYQAPVNILACAASILMSFASFQNHDQPLRIWMMFGSLAWLTHNVIVRSPAAVLLELFFLTSNLVGYWRFYIRERRTADL